MSRERNSEWDIGNISQRKRFCAHSHETPTSSQTQESNLLPSQDSGVESNGSMTQALSIDLILKEIFTNLSSEDLVNCCKTSSKFLEVADPIMCFYRISTTIPSYDIPCEVKVEKIVGYPGVREKFTTDFRGLVARLNSCIHKKRMFIELQITDRPHFKPESDIYIPFLTAFGHRVHFLNYESLSTSVDVKRYSQFLSYLPNLEMLKGNELDLIGGGAASAVAVELPTLRNLKRVQFGESANFDLWDYVLKNAPNLKEIFGFPIDFSVLLNRFQDPNPVRSLVGFDPQPNGDLQRFEACLQQLAGLNVKLTQAALPNFYNVTVRTNGSSVEPGHVTSELAENIKAHIWRILESSKGTLEMLSIPPATYLDYYFPIEFQMSSVRMLQFEDNAAFIHIEGNPGSPPPGAAEEEHRYFPRRTNLLSIFPNLDAIQIKFNHVNRNVASFFPRDTFGPSVLGLSIKTLETSIISSYYQLALTFPHVIHLKIRSTVDHFCRVFPEISYGWPLLETLVVSIDSSESFHNQNYLDEAKYSLDSILTGIPPGMCTDLHKSMFWKREARQLDLERLQRENISLRSMTRLSRLEIIVEESALRCRLCNRDHLRGMITPLGVKYGILRLKPALKVTVRMGNKIKKY